MKWQPWQTALRRAAVAQGFPDPIRLLAHLRQFGQPAEVDHPVELLRAGATLHARGLLNARIIQHNLDWRWPYWVRRQYDPHDISFMPRAFALTHINLTHRNWTAIGLPDIEDFPIVDPAGLVTPHLDGWSIDVWVRSKDGQWLVPAYTPSVAQSIDLQRGLAVSTRSQCGAQLALSVRAEAVYDNGDPRWAITCEAHGREAAWLVIALRPFNPEGISFITDVVVQGGEWLINGAERITLETPPDLHQVSNYAAGDVHTAWDEKSRPAAGVSCAHGMATVAAAYRLDSTRPRSIKLHGPLRRSESRRPTALAWPTALLGLCEIQLPDPRMQMLFEMAKRTLVLLSPDDVYPGPYTYRRFWFRDAAFLIDAMLALGMIERAERAVNRFYRRQTAAGYFRSQEGEWDSNGEALWIIARHHALGGTRPDAQSLQAIGKAAEWIRRKRLPASPAPGHGGLLPAGFSAEHLGPNDYYYWDNFWGVAGLQAASTLLTMNDPRASAAYGAEARAFQECIDSSLAQCAARLERQAMPAAPYRRLDSGAIGSLVAGYPLQLVGPCDPRLLDTAEYLLAHHCVSGAFFQDNIHSGLNAYLTLHLAQVLQRAGDPRAFSLIETVAQLATPTGQWPEAIHPRTGGGCMGDGQHAWAAAEWVLLLRNSFVREESGHLVLGAGIPVAWLEHGRPITLGPTLTRHGLISVSIRGPADAPRVSWHGQWRSSEPRMVCALPGYEREIPAPGRDTVTLRRLLPCTS